MTEETNKALGIRSPWAGKAVSLESLEEELALLWRMAADNMRTGQNLSVRTSVLNFIICAATVEAAQNASALLRNLLSTNLARVIVLILDDRQSPSTPISTWITLRSFPVISDITRHSFEQITVLITDAAVPHSASIIQPLLKPDLPVYLWWLGDPPTDGTTFHRLVRISNRVIVDSASFLNPEQDIRTLMSLLQVTPDCAISDLNWSRLTSWRQLVAQFFDAAEYRPYLEGINRIEIEHVVAFTGTPTYTERGVVSSEPAHALFLAGWLKERLGWTLSSDTSHDQLSLATGTYHWTMQQPTGQPALVDILPRVEPEMHPGTICLLRLTSQVDGKQATFTINRDGDAEHVLTSVELNQESRSQRTVSMAAEHKENELLYEELEIIGHDHLFEETLQEVAALLQ